jgi:hypothetical protein
MTDIDLELRMRLMRVRPELSLSHATSLIREVASSCVDLRDEVEKQDFFVFCYVDGAALAAIFRQSTVEFLAFAADESLIHESEHLAMVDVNEFMQLARDRFNLSDDGLMLPISQALPWMERHRNARGNGGT